MKNHYQVLGLDKNATLDEIRTAYKEYVVKFHPDKHNGDEFFKERFQEIQESYDYLSKHYKEYQFNDSYAPNMAYDEDFTIDIENVNFSCFPINIKKGETITFKWSVKTICLVSLIIDNGYTTQTFDDLNKIDSKSIKINRLNGNIIATLNCFNKDSSVSKTIYISERKESDSKSLTSNFTLKDNEKISKNQMTSKSGCLYDFTIITIDLIVFIALIILLEWLLFTYCSFNVYIMIALAILIMWGCAEINGVILRKYFPNLGMKKNSPNKEDNI